MQCCQFDPLFHASLMGCGLLAGDDACKTLYPFLIRYASISAHLCAITSLRVILLPKPLNFELLGFWFCGLVGARLSARAMVRKMSAWGQAEAKATRIREAISITRAALEEAHAQYRELCNGQSGALRDLLLNAPHQPECRGVQDHAHLVGIG